MKFKNFTKAYFLIKGNNTYGNSFGKRAMAMSGAAFIGAYVFWNVSNSRLEAHDHI